MKKKIVCLVATVLTAGIFVAGAFFIKGKFELNIHEKPISKEEYLYVMNQQIYDVSNELTENRDIQIDEKFWETEIEGTVPYKKLADQTIEQLKYYRAVYETAIEEGYVEYADYEHMIKRMEEENKMRAEKIENGEPVFGLSKFTTELYMEYEMDSFQKRYCENLKNEGMEITEEERVQYYEKNKDALFQKNDDITLDYIKIPYLSENMAEEQKELLEKELISIYKSMDGSQTLQKLVAENEMLSPYFSHEELLSSEVSSKAKVIGDVLDLGYELKIGESTQVVDENGALYLVQCTAKNDYDYFTVDEVKDNINKELREQHYNSMIEKKAADLEVDGDMKKVYDFTKKHIKK